MQQTILFKASGRRTNRPLVILTGPMFPGEYSIPVRQRLSRALSSAWRWTRCNCTPLNILRALFCAKVSMAVATVVVSAMWWHNITIADTLAAQKAVGIDGLLGMPWAVVWAFRASRMPMPEEGGDK